MPLIQFSKYSGCGNDFILIDNRELKLSYQNRSEIARLCDRHQGIGGDGLIFLENGPSAQRNEKLEFTMRIFNADGSEAEMCGNGIRCLARFLDELGISRNLFSIKTMHEIIEVALENEHVSVKMPKPKDLGLYRKLCIEEEVITMHTIDTGVPHAIFFSEDMDSEHWLHLAPKIRHHPYFPKGSNVNWVSIKNAHSLSVRTYERGVEKETWACGTGATAAALVAAETHGLKSPITAYTASKDSLKICFDKKDLLYRSVIMTGPASKIYHGEINSLL